MKSYGTGCRKVPASERRWKVDGAPHLERPQNERHDADSQAVPSLRHVRRVRRGWTWDPTDSGSGATVYCDCAAGNALRESEGREEPSGYDPDHRASDPDPTHHKWQPLLEGKRCEDCGVVQGLAMPREPIR